MKTAHNDDLLEEAVYQIIKFSNLIAYEDEGMVCIEFNGENKEAVADAIKAALPYGWADKLEWVKSDEPTNTTWFRLV